MNNKNINLKPISKIDFGKRKLSSKEFTLLWMMVLSHFSKMEEAIEFQWWDIALYNKSNIIFYLNAFKEIKCFISIKLNINYITKRKIN